MRWYPGRYLIEKVLPYYLDTVVPYLEAKISGYSKKFKNFDRRVVEGCAICYKFSPLYRQHIDSPHFGETLGWRITHLWTKDTKGYEPLSMIGPLDLGLYAVRIDSILGRTNLQEFVETGRIIPAFRKYIEATEHLYLGLIARGELSWLSEKNGDIGPAADLCAKYSPTFMQVQENGRGDGWGITKVWVDRPNSIKSLRRIYPLDVALYGVRLDSVINGTDLSEFAEAMQTIPAFSRFPMEVLRFVSEIRSVWGL